MPGTVAPFPYHQFHDNNGDPAAGFKLFSYAAGTSTKQNTYTDADLLAANTNPIILDAAGRAKIFLDAKSYKFVLAPANDTDPPTSPIWTIDEVDALSGFNPTLDVQATAGENLAVGECVHLADGSGGLTGGRWYRADADNFYQSSTAPLIGFATGGIPVGETGTVRIVGRVTGLSGLVAGARYYVSATAGALTTSRLPNQRLVGQADSTTALLLLPGPLQWRQLVVTFGTFGGAALTSAENHYVYNPYSGIITGWTLFGDITGSIVIDVRQDTYANFPPTSADTIAGSERPTLTSQSKNQDDNLSTWTPQLLRDSVLMFHVESATVGYASLTLEILTV